MPDACSPRPLKIRCTLPARRPVTKATAALFTARSPAANEPPDRFCEAPPCRFRLATARYNDPLTAEFELLAPLRRYWGYDGFRPLQERVVRSLLAGRDV